MSSFPELLQSKQIDEQNSTSEREELSEKGKEDALKLLGYPDFTVAAETVQVMCQVVQIFGALVTLATMEAILSAEGAFSSDIQHLLAAFRSAFTGFMASLILFLLSQSVTTVMCYDGQGFCSWTLRLCTGVALIGLTGAFAIRSRRNLTTTIWFSASVVVVLVCIGLQVLSFLFFREQEVLSFLRKPLENWDRHSQGTLEKCSKHWDTDESEDHQDPALSDPQETVEADQLHQTSRVNLLLLLGILSAASIPYHVGLQAPGGFWQPNATDGQHHYNARAGDTMIPQTTYPEMYEGVYYNATATIFRTRRTKYCALQDAMVPDLHGQFRVYATGNCRGMKSSNVQTFSLLQIAESNWTIEREASSENDKEDAMPMRALAYQASKYETFTVDVDTYVKFWSDNVAHRAIAFSASVVAIGFFTSLVILIILSNKNSRHAGKYQACKYYESQEALTGQGAFLMVYAAGNCSESADDPAVDDEDNRANRRTKRSPREATWRVAYAAPHHMTGNRSLLLTGGYMPVLDSNDGEEVLVVNLAANGEAVPLRVRGSGSVRTENIALDDVWYVPGLHSNLVSTGQLARQGCAVNLGPGGCRITRGGGALVGTARFTEECQFELDFLKVAA